MMEKLLRSMLVESLRKVKTQELKGSKQVLVVVQPEGKLATV